MKRESKVLKSTLLLKIINMKDNASSFATGFLFNFSNNDNPNGICIVTNAHAVGDAIDNDTEYTLEADYRSWDEEAKPLINLPLDNRNVILHPDYNENDQVSKGVDLAVILIGESIDNEGRNNGRSVLTRTILTFDNIPSNDFIEKMSIAEDVIMIGYPYRHMDGINGLPIIRKGSTAIPYNIDYGDRPIMLLDIACHDGSSGSPIFSAKHHYLVNKPILLGINKGVQNEKLYVEEMKGYDNSGVNEDRCPFVSIPIDISICIKSRELLKFCKELDILSV